MAIESMERGLFLYYVELNARPVNLGIAQATDGTKHLSIPAEHWPALLALPGFPTDPKGQDASK